jgi:DNA-directed RNA polymerase subunit M/transcription elongation factor TFIIS
MSKPIHLATSADAIQLLLDHGANINSIDKNGHTPLHYSVIQNNMDLIKLFIDKGANINDASNQMKKTALHYAAEKDRIHTVNYLLDRGADPLQKDIYGFTPITISEMYKHHSIANTIRHHMTTKIISDGLIQFNLSNDDHKHMTDRIYKACNHYAHKYTVSNQATLTHILYLKIDYVIKKLNPSLIKKIIDETDPLRIKTLLMNELYAYDEDLQDERETLINKEQTCMIEDKWESDRQCPRCRQRKYKVRQVITRCIDEGTTMKADCICGNTFRL